MTEETKTVISPDAREIAVHLGTAFSALTAEFLPAVTEALERAEDDREISFVAIVEHTNLVGTEHYGGQHIVYVSNYLESNSSLLEEDVESIVRLYVPHLRKINPSFDESWIVGRHLFHARDAQPVFTVGAGDRLPYAPVLSLLAEQRGRQPAEDQIPLVVLQAQKPVAAARRNHHRRAKRRTQESELVGVSVHFSTLSERSCHRRRSRGPKPRPVTRSRRCRGIVPVRF